MVPTYLSPTTKRLYRIQYKLTMAMPNKFLPCSNNSICEPSVTTYRSVKEPIMASLQWNPVFILRCAGAEPLRTATPDQQSHASQLQRLHVLGCCNRVLVNRGRGGGFRRCRRVGEITRC